MNWPNRKTKETKKQIKICAKICLQFIRVLIWKLWYDFISYMFGHKVRGERMPLQIRCTRNNNIPFISHECGGKSTYTNRMQFTPVGILAEYMYICKNLLKSVSYIQRTVRFALIHVISRIFLVSNYKISRIYKSLYVRIASITFEH